MVRTLAIDCETVGLEGPAYCVTTFNPDDGPMLWKGSVSGDGKVSWPAATIQNINQYIDGARLVGHNCLMFDRQKLVEIGVTVDAMADTMLASHVCNSSDPRGLKELSLQYLGISADDESDLLKMVNKANARIRHAHTVWETSKIPNSSDLTWGEADKLRKMQPQPPGKGSMWILYATGIGVEEHDHYAKLDAVRTWGLWMGLNEFAGYYNVMTVKGWMNHYRRLAKLCPIFLRMEQRGIMVDTDNAAEVIRELVLINSIAESEVTQNYKINPRSTQQIQRLMIRDMGGAVYASKRTKTGFSVDQTTIANILDKASPDSPIAKAAKALHDYRTTSKRIDYASQYVKKSVDGILYSSINPVGSGTTRRSTSSPNTQNITSLLRRLFRPRPNHVFVLIDYSNLELRLFAYISGEPTLTKWFAEGKDVHQLTGDSVATTLASQTSNTELADRIRSKVGTKEIRKVGKLQGFGILYGSGAKKLGQIWLVNAGIRIPNPQEILEAHYATFPGIRTYTRNLTHSLYNTDGRVYTAYGYPLVPPLDRPYACVDYVVQGTAGQVTATGLINSVSKIEEADLSSYCHPLLEIHDEIVFEVHEDYLDTVVPILKTAMEDNKLSGLHTPVAINVCWHNWADEEPYVSDNPS